MRYATGYREKLSAGLSDGAALLLGKKNDVGKRKTSALTSSLLNVRTKDLLLPVETVMKGSRHEEVRKDNGIVIWLLQKQDQKEIITLGFHLDLEREIHYFH